MLRRTVPQSSGHWARYRLIGAAPRQEGPPPRGAPQNFNDTKAVDKLDPIEDKFPTSIRGRLLYPDVPLDDFQQLWYIGDRTPMSDELTSWTAIAPPKAYRFRPFDEFDHRGRVAVEQLRRAARSKATSDGSFPEREPYLTKMAGAKTPKVPLETVLDRAVQQSVRRLNHKSVLEVQRDVGRVEKVPSCAGKIPVDATAFPFRWKTDDWYEYEVSKVRNKRFGMQNSDTCGPQGSEVTYRMVIEADWDHHAARMADDVAEFLKDIGRQLVEQKLVSVRRTLDEVRAGAVMDPDYIASFPPGKEYSLTEMRGFMIAELEALETQCVSILGKTSSGEVDRYDASSAWPSVEKLEPWARMAEYWQGKGDKHWSHMEASSARVEFRKYYRVITCKMPFVSLEFEKRWYDVRHWAHRGCNIEYQTIRSMNLVHDTVQFPTEPDYVQPHSHENHRLYSFALDWYEGPQPRTEKETVREGDTWSSVAARLGVSERELLLHNSAVDNLATGVTLDVPPTATKAVTSFGTTTATLPVGAYKSWEEIATAFDCDADDLRDVNVEYCNDDGSLKAGTSVVKVPHFLLENSAQNEFASEEVVLGGDSWETIAKRLGSSVESLKAANVGITTLAQGSLVQVPADASHPRRLRDPLLRVDTEQTLTAHLQAEKQKYNLPEGVPTKPHDAADFPYEFIDSTSVYPFIPSNRRHATSDWLAYTSTYLDRDLTQKAEPASTYNVNQLWPFQQIPGREDQTPFEEDQTWMMHHTPVQRQQMFHAEGHVQDLPEVNHEMFPKSLQWQAP